eukprot:667345_1
MASFYETKGAIIAVACVTSILFIKMMVTSGKAKSPRKWAPEDYAAWKKDPDEHKRQMEREKEEFTKGDRWRNIYLNDSENIPYALFIFWGLVIVNGPICAPSAFYLSIFYCLFRLLHTIFYALGIQGSGSKRSLMWAFGQLTSLIAAVMLVVGAIVKYS